MDDVHQPNIDTMIALAAAEKDNRAPSTSVASMAQHRLDNDGIPTREWKTCSGDAHGQKSRLAR